MLRSKRNATYERGPLSQGAESRGAQNLKLHRFKKSLSLSLSLSHTHTHTHTHSLYFIAGGGKRGRARCACPIGLSTPRWTDANAKIHSFFSSLVASRFIRPTSRWTDANAKIHYAKTHSLIRSLVSLQWRVGSNVLIRQPQDGLTPMPRSTHPSIYLLVRSLVSLKW